MAILRPHRLPLLPLIVARERLAGAGRPREVGGEPAVMDEPQGVKEYDELGAGVEVGMHHFNALAISRLLPEGGTVVDLGCGTARLLERLARGRPDARIIGFDLSEPMLETGRARLAREGLGDRIELRLGDITTFDAELEDRPDVVSCNFALHHLPNEDVASRCLEAIARVRGRTGCAVWIFDFARLRHPKSMPGISSLVNFPGPVVLSDAIASEQAAFTLAELTTLLERAGLGDLEHLSSRPLGEHQVHWAPGHGRPAPKPGLWQDVPLPRGTRLLAIAEARAFPRSLTDT